ncbi:hypothetical protein LguiB_023986 [Lonicera macranthoides]
METHSQHFALFPSSFIINIPSFQFQMTSQSFFSPLQTLNLPISKPQIPPFSPLRPFYAANSTLCTCTGSPIITRRTTRNLTVNVSSDSTVIADDPSVSSTSVYTEEEEKAMSKVGSRVRVKVPLKVYHIPKVNEVELQGREGVLKQYVGVWKGKRISANYPFKVAFVEEVEGREGPVKFFVHLREDEFEYLD